MNWERTVYHEIEGWDEKKDWEHFKNVYNKILSTHFMSDRGHGKLPKDINHKHVKHSFKSIL